MMRHRNRGKRIAVALICVLMFSLVSTAVFAAEPHEDPETAAVVFSGISLFRYYAESLDFVLGKNLVEVEARLTKMPFASIPQSLMEATDNFNASGISLSFHIVGIDEDLGKLRTLVEQYRQDEALEQMVQISDNLSWANSQLKLIEQSTRTIGADLAVSSAPASSDLRRSYDEIMQRIDRIRETLDLYQNLLTELTLIAEAFKPTAITLEIEPMVAFVGDDIHFEGVLTFQGQPLAGREVDILLNGSSNITVRTDADGRYQGVLSVPYWYAPELDVQALYYPRDNDIGLYIASLSPVVELEVLFYKAVLGHILEDKVYPGRETVVGGLIYYGQSPRLEQRKAEIYLDKVFITEFVAQEVFAQQIRIDAETDVGEHLVTISAAGVDRYAPVQGSAFLNVTRATPSLDINIPKVTLIPGGIELKGKLSSEVGPLSGALIKMRLDDSRVELTSAEDGTFSTKIKVGLGLGIIGWRDLAIQVVPQEPWHTSLGTTSRVLMVNMLNTGGLLVILVLLGIYLPGRLRKRLGVYSRRRVKPVIPPSPLEPVATYGDSLSLPVTTEESEPDSGEPRRRIFYWYRLVVRLLLRIARVSLRPQQTLREFAYEHSRLLGPGAKYFNELTRIVERLLYSQYRPTEADVENSRQLSLRVEEESKPEGVTLPSTERGTKGGRKG